jgi:hypothetical protein
MAGTSPGGKSKAGPVSARDYVKLVIPEPDVIRVIGQESEQNGASTLTLRQIDQIIKTSRSRKPKRYSASVK